MSKFRPRHLRLRALIADVLPFEVPLTFTNDFFFASTLPLRCLPEVARALDALRTPGVYTIPHNYDIVKERGKTLSLSIAHPVAQLRMARLMDDYAETMISYCDKSDFTLRRPSEIVSLFADRPIEYDETVRDGLPHELLEDGAPDFSRMASYFRLRRYNLLAKFIDSDEFVELEKRFSKLLSLDVSKCFYNIYTHSIAWAVKSKEITKRNLRSYTFESRFDETMQFANYKETNGIIVGPEVSRIFAEIIMQQIDRDLALHLHEEHELSNTEFAIRRYVDDYSIFAHNDQVLEVIQTELSERLGAYKLYLNSDKRVIQNRPFVSSITRMKHAISTIIDDVGSEVRALVTAGISPCEKSVSNGLRSKLRNCRIILHSPDVGFHNVSGWLLWKFRRMVRDGLRLMNRAKEDDERDCASRIVAALFETIFYVVALDFRVRSGFNLAVIVNELRRSTSDDASEQADWLNSYVFEELLNLTASALGRNMAGSLELTNLLLLGAHAYGERYVRSSVVRAALMKLDTGGVGYFKYVTAKFCYLKDTLFFGDALKALNDRTRDHVKSRLQDLSSDAETHLLFCDLVSAPDVSLKEKGELLDLALDKHIRDGRLPATTGEAADQLSQLIGFTDWTGARLHYTLARRQLRASREY